MSTSVSLGEENQIHQHLILQVTQLEEERREQRHKHLAKEPPQDSLPGSLAEWPYHGSLSCLQGAGLAVQAHWVLWLLRIRADPGQGDRQVILTEKTLQGGLPPGGSSSVGTAPHQPLLPLGPSLPLEFPAQTGGCRFSEFWTEGEEGTPSMNSERQEWATARTLRVPPRPLLSLVLFVLS